MRLLCLSAVVALAFVSCKKTDNETVIFNGSTQQFVADEGFEKVYINPNNMVVFEQGDLVKLFNLSTSNPSISEMATYAARETGELVHFQLADNPMSTTTHGAFYAFYPGENVTSATLNTDNKAVFKLNTVQEYRLVDDKPTISKKDLYMASMVTGVQELQDANFQFDNICGILALKYYDTEGWTLKSLRVEDKHFGLTGDVHLYVPGIRTNGLVEVCEAYDPANPEATATQIADFKYQFGYSVTNADNKVTLDLGEEGFTLSQDSANPSVFYIVLRPLALSHGYRVIATDMNGNEYTIVDSDNNKKILPNTIKSIKAKDLASFH